MGDKETEKWEKVFSTNAVYQAEILRALLEKESIGCVIVNKQDSSYLSFGEIEVYVKTEDMQKAKLTATKISGNE
jgi:hypothetical protein